MFQRTILDNKTKVMTGTYVFPDAKDIKQGPGENKLAGFGSPSFSLEEFSGGYVAKFHIVEQLEF